MITSLHDYQMSVEIRVLDSVTFYGVFMALVYMADTDNIEKLKAAFPQAVKESIQRYNAPGGILNDKEWTESIPF